MLLYKFRSLSNLDYIVDIILNQRLYCSTYDKLNDPFEGLFVRMLRHPKFGFKIPRVKNVKDLFPGDGTFEKIKICSLSASFEDVRMWSYYAKGYKGIVFEIDFSGLEANIFEVKYREKLPPYPLIGMTLLTGLTEPIKPRDLLLHKTNHWEYESEHRIIQESDENYFDISGRIKTIFLGTRTNNSHRKLLEKITPSCVEICETKINPHKTIVESNRKNIRTQ